MKKFQFIQKCFKKKITSVLFITHIAQPNQIQMKGKFKIQI